MPPAAPSRRLAAACVLALSLTPFAPAGEAAADDARRAAIVIAALAPGLAGERAGLRPGDRLWRWEQAGASGELASPFDLAETEIEYGPRGPVRLVGARGEEPLSVALSPDAWGIEARGLREDAAWRLLAAAKEAVARRQVDAALARVEEALREAAGRPVAEAHLLAFLGETLREADRLPAAAEAFDRALAARARGASGPLAAFQVAEGLSRVALGPREPHERRLRDAIAAHERLAPDSLALVRLLDALGWMLGGKEQKDLAARALAMVERLAPGTAVHARVLFSVAWGADERRAVGLLRKAAAILEKLEPEGRQTAVTLSFLGRYLDYTGEAKALEYEQRAVRLLERVAPGSGDHGHAVNNLALYWNERGDLVQAEALYRQALEIERRRQPEGFGVARGHYNLGRVLLRRREIGQAETHLKQAWDMTQAHGYGRGLAGRLLSALGRIQHDRGDLPAAEATLRRALETAARIEPAQQMNVRKRLADVLADQGRLTEAEALYRKNVEEAAGQDLRFSTAVCHAALASFVERKGDLDAAARHHRIALDLRRQQVAGTMEHAESAHAVGAIARRQGRRGEALALMREAVEALEEQGRRLGGGEEARAGFRAHYQEYYRDLEELLLELGRGTDAFEVLERSRARGLPGLLASRDVSLGARVPPELERERRAAEADYDRVFAAMTAVPSDDEAAVKLRAEHEAARHRLDEVRARVRSVSPRASAMRDPRPLDLAGVRRALDPGTLLLAFSLGTARSRVYAVGPDAGEFAAIPLAATRASIEEAVRGLRESIAARRSSALRGEVALRSSALSRVLLGPAKGRMARARRLIVVPDGALHLLPFAALRDPSRPTRYLVEAVAMHTVSSMTLHAVLAEGAAMQRDAAVVGFGDPAYRAAAAEGAAGASLERARRSGLRLEPLPATRAEVEVLRSLSPAARVWVGADATEERAKSLGPDARVIHFACHGFVDEALPLESGLALSTSAADAAGENGFLQAWEVFETIRVDADLVTLSACDTALGKDMGGEGLLGLAWAFQYAGARTVLASLWQASDAPTAELMKAFYERLAAGATKAEALRSAQIAMLRKDATASPYYWAAFTLIGAGP